MLIWNEKLQNIQNLFILANRMSIRKKKEALDAKMNVKVNNIQTTMVGIKDENLINDCNAVFSFLPRIDKMETTVFTEWETNKALSQELSQAGTKAKDAAMEIAAVTRENLRKTAEMGKIVSMGVTIGVILFLFALSLLIIRGIIRPIDRIVRFAGELKNGDLSSKLPERRDEIGVMSSALNDVVDEMRAKADIAKGIAEGDLDQEVNVASQKDSLGKALYTMLDSLNAMVGEFYEASEKVDAGATQVSASSQSLSQGATEQAASLEEITSSMTEISSQTKINAESATQANDLAVGSRDACRDGVSQMGEMIEAINAINDSSQEISKIIKTIDDIAFQTNLLALNAAVEAARAGKHGKGFAVVAQEVRTLASRSAQAAQETAQLIEGSAKKVESGNRIAEKTSTALNKINEGVTKVADLLQEIAQASADQAQGVAQINQGLNQIDAVTQQNSANAEETSSAAEDLSLQASQVRKLLLRFKLKRT